MNIHSIHFQEGIKPRLLSSRSAPAPVAPQTTQASPESFQKSPAEQASALILNPFQNRPS